MAEFHIAPQTKSRQKAGSPSAYFIIQQIGWKVKMRFLEQIKNDSIIRSPGKSKATSQLDAVAEIIITHFAKKSNSLCKKTTRLDFGTLKVALPADMASCF